MSDPLDAIAQCVHSVEEYSSLRGDAVQFACTELIHFPIEQFPLITVNGPSTQPAHRLTRTKHRSKTTHVQSNNQLALAYLLSTSQCKDLINSASQAPFGKGEQTVIDRSVRNTWQIEADNITIDSKTLSFINQSILPQACKQLGLSAELDDIEARLYKLLIYETGGHFAPHRDSEKDDGMFGTLVVLLPSQYTGGELCIEHAGKSLVVDWSTEDNWRSFAYAAFYADCRHEIKTVTSGYRVALTFNLCMKRSHRAGDDDEEPVTKKARLADPIVLSDSDNVDVMKEAATNEDVENEATNVQIPSAALNSQHPPIVRRLAKAFEQWYDANEPESILIPLNHQYTKATLTRNTLKTSDKSLLSLIDHANNLSRTEHSFKQIDHPPVIPLLCRLACTLSGTEECEEEFETSYDVSHIVPLPLIPPSRSFNLFNSFVQGIELLDSDFEVIYTDPNFNWDNEKPYDKQREWTGNEGVSVEKFYHKTGLLLVNAACRLHFIASSMDKSSLIDTVSDLFSASERCSDVTECMNWVRVVYHSIPSIMLTSFLLALSNLKKSIPVILTSESDGSKQSLNDQILSLMKEIFETSYIDFDSDKMVNELDELATSEGIEWVAPLLTSAFTRHLTCEVKHRRLSIEDGAMFLFGLFSLDSPSSTKKASKKRKAAASHWSPFASHMCSELYTQAQNQPVPSLLSGAGTYNNLLKLLLVHWSYLISDPYTSHSDEIQECIETAQWVSRCVSEFMNTHVAPKKNIKEKLEEILPDFILQLEDMIQQTNKSDDENHDVVAASTSFRSSFLPLVQSVEVYLTSQIDESLPPNNWKFHEQVSCLCKDCKLIKKFLSCPTEKQIDIHTNEKQRRHVRNDVVYYWKNPYLYVTTIRSGSSHLLRITKTQTLHKALEGKKKPLQALLQRVKSAESVIMSSTDDSASSEPIVPTIQTSTRASRHVKRARRAK